LTDQLVRLTYYGKIQKEGKEVKKEGLNALLFFEEKQQ